jgi:hypothetical protein
VNDRNFLHHRQRTAARPILRISCDFHDQFVQGRRRNGKHKVFDLFYDCCWFLSLTALAAAFD